MTLTHDPTHATTAKIGQSVPRREDLGILTGETRFTDDVRVSGELSLAVLRSPHAHARIVSIDTTAASAPGVVAVRTGAELRQEWSAPVPLLFVPPGVEMNVPAYGTLAVDNVLYVGEPVAVVEAE